MKERIQQLAQGIIQAASPELVFFPDKLSREVPADAVISFDVLVKSRNKIPFKGFFYSSDDRVRVCTPSAAGMTGSITLEVSTRNCEPTDEIIGELQMVSNAGERRLEYHFTVAGNDNSAVMPQTIEEFVKLAEQEKSKAVSVFASSQFKQLPFMTEDTRLLEMYDAICSNTKDAYALESFLVASGVKEAVYFAIDKGRDVLEVQDGKVTGTVGLSVNTWGHVHIEVTAFPEWLKVNSKVITEAYFNERELTLEYEVDSSLLHGGHNIGAIQFESSTQKVTFFVEAHKARKSKSSQHAMSKETFQGLYRVFLNYLNCSCEKENIAEEFDKHLMSCIKKHPGEIALHLMRTWLLLENGHLKEASALLEWCRDSIAKSRSEIPVEYCVFLYLDASLRQDNRVTENACKIIHKYFEAVPHLVIALVELYANHEDNDEGVLAYLEELQSAYGSSPVVYALAAQIYRRRPDLIKAESDFALYVFNYMVKYQCCPEFIVNSFLRQIPQMKAGHLLLTVLKRLYRERNTTQILTAICTLLVRQEKIGPEYCEWYEEGIRREIQLTSLNDYYLASLQLDDSTVLPVNILLYYSYKSDLDDSTRLSLYSYISNHYAKDSDMYRAYEEQMNQFAIAQLLAGNIDTKLVPLYENILSPELIDHRLAQVLPDLLFSKQISTALSYAVKVVVHYPQLCQEVSSPLNNGKACIPVYTDNAIILFEDKEGRRYIDKECRSEILMYQPELVNVCRRQSPEHLMLLLDDIYLLYQKPIQDDIVYEQVRCIMECTNLSESYRRLLVSRRIEYCYYQTQNERRKEDGQNAACHDRETAWLLGLDLSSLSVQERAKVIELYIMRNCMKEAYQAVKIYGNRLIRVSLLLKMTVCYITEMLYEEDEFLLRLGRYLIQKQQWNETLLYYMAQHYNGTTESMLRLLLVTHQTQANSSDLAERVVAQMMFTGNWGKLDEAFECYKKSGQISEMVRRAYYVLKCNEYLSGREVMRADNIQMIESQVVKDIQNQLPKIFYLALLQHYSMSGGLSEKQKRLCENIVYGYCAEQIYFGCYQGISRHIEMPHQMEGKVVVEHRSDAGKQVWAEIVVKPQELMSQQVLTEVYPGIYTMALFLFPDEQADVVIYHRTSLGKQEAERVTLRGRSSYVRRDSFYEEICRSITLAEENNEEALKRHCARMERRKRVVQDLFTLM